MTHFQKRSAPHFHNFSSKKKNEKMKKMKKMSIFKQEVRLNFTFVCRNCPFSKKKCASMSSCFLFLFFPRDASEVFSSKIAYFQKRSAPQFHQFSSKIAYFQKRSAPQFHQFSSKVVHFQMRSAPQFHKFSSKIAPFQLRSAPKFHQFSSKIMRTAPSWAG